NPEELLKKFVRKKDHIHLSAVMSRPNLLINQLCRVFYHQKPEFTVSVTGIHSNANAIALSGICSRMITGFLGDNYPRPIPNRLYENVWKGNPFELELWSLWSFVQRLMAGSMKLEYTVSNSLLGSDMISDKLGKTAFIQNDSEGKEILLLKAMNPDITLIHSVVADEEGNFVLSEPGGESFYGALAAKRGILVSAEKIVPAGMIPSSLISVSGTNVLGVVEIPFGTHPQSLRVPDQPFFASLGLETYLDDYSFIEETNRLTGGAPADRQDWLENWILENSEPTQYFRKLGVEFPQRVNPKKYAPKTKKEAPQKANSNEQIIVLAARKICSLVKKNGYKSILAGIGAAHISAWLASLLLKKEGIQIPVLAELGFYDVTPYKGDVFLFSQLHADNSASLTDIQGILGTAVPDRCLGVLGAAEIDLLGNLNSTLSADGKFIVGSGGANDIASTADCLAVARIGKGRAVSKVSYVTSPGKRVISLVTQFGVFDKNGAEEFSLSSFLPVPEKPDLNASECIEKFSDWKIGTEEFLQEEGVLELELAILRELDPERIYIG
ncbi:MAG TPA: CoA-transferase, partial [Leptospiraceae bacterium]|nr:CoA-transferase [Leptospiraceae bacterium]